MSLEEEYVSLRNDVEEFIAIYNPCAMKDGACLMVSMSGKPGRCFTGGCARCKHGSDTGCTVRRLQCLMTFCPAAIARITHNSEGHVRYEELALRYVKFLKRLLEPFDSL